MNRPFWLVLLILLTGCSADSAWAPSSDAHAVTAEGATVDLYFHPLDLRDGEAVEVEVGTARLRSVAQGGEHRVALTEATPTARSATGLLDGKAQLAIETDHDAGFTSNGPTSVHRYTECRGGDCTQHVEYDYDLHDPSGDGTTSWRTPDGRSATIDRLRFQLDAAPAGPSAQLRLVTPEPAIMAEVSPVVK